MPFAPGGFIADDIVTRKDSGCKTETRDKGKETFRLAFLRKSGLKAKIP